MSPNMANGMHKYNKFVQSPNDINLTEPKIIVSIEKNFTSKEMYNPIQRSYAIANTDMQYNHSNDNLDETNKLTDLDRCTIKIKRENECQYEPERRYSVSTGGYDRCELHKKEDIYGKESIIRKRVDVYGYTRQSANLKFKFIKNAREWMQAVGWTMDVRVQALVVIGLLLTMLTTCTAAPTKARPARSVHHEKSAVSYKY